MRSLRRVRTRVGQVAALVVIGAALASPSRAETCGDADGSGTVSVTDGVQVLRTAAGLDADCTTIGCDVDASGSVTVSDGVNVLRAAAGLPVELRCAELSAQEQQVFGALRKSNQVTRLLALGLEASGDADATAAAAVSCPKGGTVTPVDGAMIYDGCRVRSTVCSGTAAFENGTFSSDLQCQDVAEGRLFALAADVVPTDTASGRAITGTAAGTQGSTAVFQFDYDAFTLDENDLGGRSAGEIGVGGAFFAGVFQQVEVSFPGRNPATGAPDPGFAKIVGLRPGGGGIIFVFVFDVNLATGKLTPR